MGKGIACGSGDLRAGGIDGARGDLGARELEAHAVIWTFAPHARACFAKSRSRWGGFAGGFTISWAFSPRDYADGCAPPYPPREREL